MIHLINHTPYPIASTSLQRELTTLIQYLEKKYGRPAGEINYCFLSKREIQQLNREFLGKKTPTDVLSFPDGEAKEVAGDIGVCLEIVREDAKNDKKDFGKYLAEVLLHGSLHLFGLEHDYTPKSLEEVYRLHRDILAELKLNWRAFNVKSFS